MSELVDWLLVGLVLATAAAIALWMAGAIYFDVAHAARWGKWAVVVWLAGVVALFAMWQPLWQPLLALVGVAAAFTAWWLAKKPSHDREWDIAVAVLPRAVCDGDAVTIENLRNFEYSSATEFTPRYESRTVHLANLVGVDIVFFNWGVRWMSHPVLTFDFGPDGRICFSIEVRYRKGQGFAVLRSFYRQQELIFVAADERDVILRRTKCDKPQEAILYRLQIPAEESRTAFLDYIAAVNALYDVPRWYHGLFANCTTTYYRLPNSRRRFDWRVFANGLLDRALYEDGRLDRSLPFEELRRQAMITDIANSAPEAGFGDHLRHVLAERRHGR